MTRVIPMFMPFMSEEAIAAATVALRQRTIGEGETVKQFERALCARFGFANALLLNSGTSGLRLALAVSGVGPGDEVISTAMTCTATNTAILEQYAHPVFADIQPETGNLDPADIGHRITSRTKAIVCVHWGGYPCDLDELQAIAQEHGLALIEDAAHALGARYHGANIGTTAARFTVFSFQAIKHLTTIDGGLLVCQWSSDYQEAKERRWFGIDRDKRKPSTEWPGYYDWPQEIVGYKYQPNNVQAAIGLGNLMHFDRVLEHRVKLASFYRRELEGVPGLRLFDNKGDRKSAWWLFTIHVEKRQRFHEMMKRRGIETTVAHIRNDLHPVFGGRREDLPNLDRFEKTYLCLPCHQAVTTEDAGYVVDCIRAGW